MDNQGISEIISERFLIEVTCVHCDLINWVTLKDCDIEIAVMKCWMCKKVSWMGETGKDAGSDSDGNVADLEEAEFAEGNAMK